MFDIFIDKFIPEPNSGCWLWTGACTTAGYGQFKKNRKVLYAHRAFYESVHGKIPAGLQLDHKCRVRCCVNPDHLQPVIPRENVLLGEGIAAKNAGKQFCISGHEFTEDNTRITRRGRRACIKCSRINWRKWWIKRKQR